MTNKNSIKAKSPDRFHQTHLFRKTLGILESHHFRLPARRFALDLFDKGVMRRIVLEEDSDLDSEGGSSRGSSQDSGSGSGSGLGSGVGSGLESEDVS